MPDKSSMRGILWCAMQVIFMLGTAVAAIARGVESPRLLYLWLLFAVCSMPVLIRDAINGRYAVLWVMMAVYFVLYAVSDVLSLFVGAPASARGLIDTAEVAIVVGAGLLVLGFCMVARAPLTVHAPDRHYDWHAPAILCAGLVLWTVGITATLYWQVKLQTRSFSLSHVSPALGMVVTLGRMVQPLGTALLAYQTVRSKSTLMLVLMLVLLSAEFVVGFVCDSKELSIRGMIVLLAAMVLIQGRVPKGWLIAAAVVAVLSFPVFQAYRYEVLGVRGQAREQAALDLKKNLAIALQSITEPGAYGSSAGPGFIGRVSLKSNMELVADRVGDTVAYQNGHTYLLFLQGFVPRILWPDKPDASVGQLFNRELHISAFRDVYISPSFLGEAYWNFGWPGVIAGMFLIGALLGMVGLRTAMSEGVTVTRFLVVLLTIYSFCMRFEGGIALEALVWLRSLLAVAVLHWLFARKKVVATSQHTSEVLVNMSTDSHRPVFANLMH